jgi:hypothetical protein
MFGFGIGAVPVDKESVRTMAAFRYLDMKRQAALRGVTEDYKRQVINESFDKKELALMRHVAGPLARFIDR